MLQTLELVLRAEPAALWVVLAMLTALAAILRLLLVVIRLLTANVHGVTALRRAFRSARISARAEGWGAPLDDVELVTQLEEVERRGEPQATDERARSRQPPDRDPLERR